MSLSKRRRTASSSTKEKKGPVSKSQELRFVLYKRWEVVCSPAMTPFEEFYTAEMDSIISEEKFKIDNPEYGKHPPKEGHAAQ